MTTDLLFVYGTLLRDAGHPMHQVLLGQSDFVSPGRLQGRLYAVQDYPGAVVSDRPDEWVHGELYAMRDPLTLLKRLDLYEACDVASPQPHEYRREIRPIMLPDDAYRPAWVYLYLRDTARLQAIPSGYYLEPPRPAGPQ
jgi:gamma-glutamylcyclotransferase (GGCT)/AIG2-like uncharacterized protein YtfP